MKSLSYPKILKLNPKSLYVLSATASSSSSTDTRPSDSPFVCFCIHASQQDRTDWVYFRMGGSCCIVPTPHEGQQIFLLCLCFQPFSCQEICPKPFVKESFSFRVVALESFLLNGSLLSNTQRLPQGLTIYIGYLDSPFSLLPCIIKLFCH